MSDDRPNLAEILHTAIEGAMTDARVALPGQIQDYDASRRRAVVQILVQDVVVNADGERKLVTIPPLTDVPVGFWGWRSPRIRELPRRGDQCWVSFASSSIAQWKATGRIVDPGSDRHHHIADAVAMPLFMVGEPAGQPFLFFDDLTIRLGSDTATQPVPLGNALLTNLSTLITVIASAFTALPASAGVAGGTAVSNALLAFQNASATYLSSTVKTI